jgi:hypothetical protein
MKKTLLTITLMAAAAISNGFAQSVNWGNTPGDVNLQSDGTSILDGTFTFELGTFDSGFILSNESPDTWGSAWNAIDVATYVPNDGYFSELHVFEDNTYAGQQGYIFIYNYLNGDDSSEWFLTTNSNWVIPSSSGGQIGLPLEWRVFNASVVEYGQTPDDIGEGEGTPPSGTYALQSFTFVPEPSTTLLFGALLGSIFFRRSRD